MNMKINCRNGIFDLLTNTFTHFIRPSDESRESVIGLYVEPSKEDMICFNEFISKTFPDKRVEEYFIYLISLTLRGLMKNNCIIAQALNNDSGITTIETLLRTLFSGSCHYIDGQNFD